MTQDIINQNVLRGEIRKITKEELQKIVPKNQVSALWKFLNKLDERIKCLEK